MWNHVLATALSVLVASAAVAQPQSGTKAESPAPVAQTPATQATPDGGMPTFIRPETPEQRQLRLGTVEDPGIDPDPGKHFWRFGLSFHISKYERRLAAYDREPGTVRPLGMINIAYEIYQQNDKWVWVWIGDPPPAAEMPSAEETAVATAKASNQWSEAHINFFRRIRSQFFDLAPPSTKRTVRFAESSNGLPTAGSWRNSLAVADMNGDGHLDLIAPPERGGRSTNQPSIFLGDGKGNWRFWAEIQWPAAFDYGSVAAADLNKDGHQDLVLGVHLRGVFVLLGDGAGHFTHVEEGLPRDFPTRRVIITDLDQDGYPDLVAVSEGPTAVGTGKGSKVRGYLNRKKGQNWELLDISDPTAKVGGDWATAGDMNGDSKPDLIVGNVWFSEGTATLYASAGPKQWKTMANDGDLLPSLSYYGANAMGRFTSKKRQDAIVSYARFWPTDVDSSIIPAPLHVATTNIDRLTFTDAGLKREPIIRWGGREGVSGLSVGDFDGDGNDDILYLRQTPRGIGLLLGDGKGGVAQAKVEGVDVEGNASYDLRTADVNRDGKLDIILMYETAGTTALADRDGSIHVFLNRGATASAE